jgi:hypothetical protein
MIVKHNLMMIILTMAAMPCSNEEDCDDGDGDGDDDGDGNRWR